MKKITMKDLFDETEGVELTIFITVFHDILGWNVKEDDSLSVKQLKKLYKETDEENATVWVELMQKFPEENVWHWFLENFDERYPYLVQYIAEVCVDTEKIDLTKLLFDAHASYLFDQVEKIHKAVGRILKANM